MTDQILDLKSLYDPLPQQVKFHASPAKYRLYGGACGGGKTYAVIWEAILRCLKYDFPVTGAIFRSSYPELDSTIIRTMREILPNWFYKYNQAQHVMTFKTGDRIEFCYAETYSDVMRYQSREWDWLGIDELTHFSEEKFTYLMTRVRTSKALKPKFFAATNPGGVGHAWVKSRWVDKDSKEQGYDPKEYDFIPAKVEDNSYLMKANPDYINNLKMLPENERKALLDGSWEIFEGMFFTEFEHSRHVVNDFTVPENWQLVLGWDDGFRAPRAVALFAIDNDRRVWCIWEYYREGETLLEAARNVKRELEDLGYWENILKLVVDPSMRARSSQEGTTSKEILENFGFGFKMGEVELGNNKREEGWRLVRTYLKHEPYEEPMLKFFAGCENMIRTIPQMVYHQDKAGESKKEDLDTRGDDHCVDLLRYVLMSLEDTPGRFKSVSNLEILGRGYSPRSTFGDIK